MKNFFVLMLTVFLGGISLTSSHAQNAVSQTSVTDTNTLPQICQATLNTAAQNVQNIQNANVSTATSQQVNQLYSSARNSLNNAMSCVQQSIQQFQTGLQAGLNYSYQYSFQLNSTSSPISFTCSLSLANPSNYYCNELSTTLQNVLQIQMQSLLANQ